MEFRPHRAKKHEIAVEGVKEHADRQKAICDMFSVRLRVLT